MKIKPMYIYIISFLAIIALLVLFTSDSGNDALPTEGVIPHSEMPDDEVHKNLDGNAPSSGNVSENFRQKMQLMEESYNSNPDDTANAKEYARMLAAAHQPQNAVEIYEGILSKDKNRLDIRFELATVHYNLGQFNNAKEQIEMVLAVEEDNTEALYNLGAIEAAMGNAQKGKEIWQSIIDQYPDSEAASVAQQSLNNLGQ